MRRMRIENIAWLLREIHEGNNTRYALSKLRDAGNVHKYLVYAKKNGFIEQYVDGQRKPYKLTKKGKLFLKMF